MLVRAIDARWRGDRRHYSCAPAAVWKVAAMGRDGCYESCPRSADLFRCCPRWRGITVNTTVPDGSEMAFWTTFRQRCRTGFATGTVAARVWAGWNARGGRERGRPLP